MSMRERRKILLSMASVLPLFVFEFGNDFMSEGSKFDKGSRIVDGTYFENGMIHIGRDFNKALEEYEAGYLDIGGIDFGPYKTLNMECKVNVMDYDENKPYFYVGYGSQNGAYHRCYTEYEYAPASFEVLSFDISKLSGEEIFIKATSYVTGTAEIMIKNIWLE